MSPALAALQAPLAGSLATVEGHLAALVASAPALLGPLAEQLLGGGKRLRPLVLLYAAWDGDTVPELALLLAAAVEQVHFASLLHDDVLDGSSERRGRPSAPQLLGSRRAVLAGDYLAAYTFRALGEAEVPRSVAETLGRAMLAMTLSEVQATTAAGQLLSEEEYLQVIGGKTAALFSASAEMGAHAAEGDEVAVAGFRDFGEHLGLAFQMRDDLLDLYGDGHRLGKPVRRDLAAGLYTLPVLHAAAVDASGELRRLLEQLAAGAPATALAQEIADRVEALGGRAYAETRMAEHAAAAVGALPQTPAAPHLTALASWVTTRES